MGRENAFIFGLSSDEVIAYEKNNEYDPITIFNNDSEIRTVLMQLVNGFYAPNNTEEFREIYNSLLNKQNSDRADTYFILKDFRSYAKAHEEVDKAYRDKKRWAKMALTQTANVGKFSSDRTIEEYVKDIWHLTKLRLPDAK